MVSGSISDASISGSGRKSASHRIAIAEFTDLVLLPTSSQLPCVYAELSLGRFRYPLSANIQQVLPIVVQALPLWLL
jgi:hypothetical protein